MVTWVNDESARTMIVRGRHFLSRCGISRANQILTESFSIGIPGFSLFAQNRCASSDRNVIENTVRAANRRAVIIIESHCQSPFLIRVSNAIDS